VLEIRSDDAGHWRTVAEQGIIIVIASTIGAQRNCCSSGVAAGRSLRQQQRESM
jgi:hypothetical protein